MPVWLQNEGAWIAIGISIVFVVAAWVMHRLFVRILKNPAPQPTPSSPAAPTHSPKTETRK